MQTVLKPFITGQKQRGIDQFSPQRAILRLFHGHDD
jgi:hypothetical protein